MVRNEGKHTFSKVLIFDSAAGSRKMKHRGMENGVSVASKKTPRNHVLPHVGLFLSFPDVLQKVFSGSVFPDSVFHFWRKSESA